MRERLDLTKEQVAAFESPLRATLIMVLRSHGALSVREMADVLGVKPDRLYYHINFLSKLELLQVREMRPSDTRPEAVYELSSKEFYMDNLAMDPEYDRSVYRSAKNVSKLAFRRYEQALTDPEGREIVRFSFAAGRMSEAKLLELKKEMREILRRVLASNDPDGVAVLVTGLVVPTESGN